MYLDLLGVLRSKVVDSIKNVIKKRRSILCVFKKLEHNHQIFKHLFGQ